MTGSLGPRSVRQDIVTLVALCAVVLFVGLTTHGLSNWQESMRALVARDMGVMGEWVVPRVNGEAYLAKPPMVYWCQLAIARVRGVFGGDGVPGVFELRLTVALAAMLGVVATYVVTRQLLGASGEMRERSPAAAARRDLVASHAAWWSSLFLGTGILYVRSGRTGELDILLAPLTVVAIGALYVAYESHVERRRMHWRALAVGGIAVAGAALTKGPPGVVTILLGAYGGIALAIGADAACSARARAVGAAAGGLALGVPTLLNVHEVGHVVGAVLVAGAGAMVGAGLAPLARWETFKGFFGAMSRTHPVGMALVAVGAVYGWMRLVGEGIGAEAVKRAVSSETDANLVLFDPESILSNLEVVPYASGIGSVMAIVSVVWLVRRGPRGTWCAGAGLWFVIAWAGLGLLAFSVLGKGVARYMTPLWPALAMLGGAFFTHVLMAGEQRRGARARWVVGAIVVVMALGQSVWYGYGRERLYPHRHPRAMFEELQRLSPVLPPISLDYWTPAYDFYAGTHIRLYQDVGPRVPVSGVEPESLESLMEELKRTGQRRLMLVRETPHRSVLPELPVERLSRAGFVVEPAEVASEYRIDNGKTRVRPVWVSASR
ncbi:MAG: phospholipid carrier-dependent glycosyltransferase [Phycisphaeraceae bacterium]|nr:MAG: phospholipid carrier-dependent glycosyltransferase [Phycisphaeraceae bacterium]